MGLLQEMGDRLYEAMQARQPIPPLTDTLARFMRALQLPQVIRFALIVLVAGIAN